MEGLRAPIPSAFKNGNMVAEESLCGGARRSGLLRSQRGQEGLQFVDANTAEKKPNTVSSPYFSAQRFKTYKPPVPTQVHWQVTQQGSVGKLSQIVQSKEYEPPTSSKATDAFTRRFSSGSDGPYRLPYSSTHLQLLQGLERLSESWSS